MLQLKTDVKIHKNMVQNTQKSDKVLDKKYCFDIIIKKFIKEKGETP